MDKLSLLIALRISVYKLCLSRSRHLHLDSLVHIAVSMSCNRNRLLPVLHKRFNTFYNNWGAEYGSVKN